jgi:ParB-like chromosome segregation protein Spo0J
MSNMLRIDSIRIDGGTQSRAALNDEAVADYAAIVRDGADFPPIVVFHDGKHYWLADGFHRWHAYRTAGATEIAADVREGTKRDAVLFSVGANTDHGLRRTNADKRSAVMVLLNDEEWSKKPETWIAETAGVSRTLVRAILSEKQDRPVDREVTRRGRTYTMNTANIGKPADVPPEVKAEIDQVKAEQKAERETHQAQNDRQREETAAQFSPAVQKHRARSEEYRAQGKAAKSKPAPDADALSAEIEEKAEYIASLEAENADLKRQIAKYDEMAVQYEQGGFEKVIAGKDEEIRVLETRLYSTNADMISWKKKAAWETKEKLRYKHEAESRGYSDDAGQTNPDNGEAVDEHTVF